MISGGQDRRTKDLSDGRSLILPPLAAVAAPRFPTPHLPAPRTPSFTHHLAKLYQQHHPTRLARLPLTPLRPAPPHLTRIIESYRRTPRFCTKPGARRAALYHSLCKNSRHGITPSYAVRQDRRDRSQSSKRQALTLLLLTLSTSFRNDPNPNGGGNGLYFLSRLFLSLPCRLHTDVVTLYNSTCLNR